MGRCLETSQAPFKDNKLQLPAMARNQVLSFSIEYDVDHTSNTPQKLQISLQNIAQTQLFSTVVRFKIFLPFTVKHTRLLNGETSLVKFTMSSNSSDPLHILSTNITGDMKCEQVGSCADQVLI
jgi:hypothetical protein